MAEFVQVSTGKAGNRAREANPTGAGLAGDRQGAESPNGQTAILVLDQRGKRVYASPAFEAIERQARAAGLPAAALLRSLRRNKPGGYDLDLEGTKGALSFFVERHVMGAESGGSTTIVLRPRQSEPVTGQRDGADRVSAERFDDVARLVSDWVWETDRDLRLSYASPRVTEVLGYHPSELRGRRWEDVFGPPPEALHSTDGAVPAPFRSFEVALAHRDGSRRIFRMSGLPVYAEDGGGAFLGFRGTAQDVTDLLEHEAALREAVEAAEAANRIKSEFLANTSHELRTPLNAIIGFTEMMALERFGPIENLRYKAYIQDVLDSAQHLLTLINDILDVAKIEAGKLDLVETALDPGEIVRRTLRLVDARAAREGVVLAAEIQPGLPPLRADERKLKQILLNLLSNAIKFTPEGGRVELRAGIDDEGGLRFAVQDTGIGIAPENHATAMAPFGQVDAQLSRRYEGTGLGLPLSSALANLHGGRLMLDSAPGEGTTVTVIFPPSRMLTV